jgi:hypothetical protein
MKIRTLTKEVVKAKPYSVWNAFVDLLAMEHYDDLTPEQRPAHLVFWYESEVQNGGHLQYFENRGIGHLAETIEGLGLLGATCQQQVLRDASQMWLGHPHPRIQTAREYCDIALKDEFGSFDSRFYVCTPTLQKCLEAQLSRHQSSFVAFT